MVGLFNISEIISIKKLAHLVISVTFVSETILMKSILLFKMLLNWVLSMISEKLIKLNELNLIESLTNVDILDSVFKFSTLTLLRVLSNCKSIIDNISRYNTSFSELSIELLKLDELLTNSIER